VLKLLALHHKVLKSQVLYDFMDLNDEMASLVVKEQLNHFKVKKVMKEEGKHPLAWHRVHEVQFLYVGFVAQQNLKIVKS
jgi:hypothetical protein